MRRRGLSLIQVLVASAVLVVALLPLFTMFSSSVRTTEVSLDELRAAYLAEEAMDQLKALAYEPGLDEIPDLPPGIKPPYEDSVDTSDPKGGFYQEGMAFPHPLKGTGQVLEIDTNNWEKVGASVVPGEDLWLESMGRVFLSPLPKGFRRKIRFFPPPTDSADTLHPGLRRIEVEVEWDRKFSGMSASQTRKMRLSSLVSSPGRVR